jgi:glycosyltransferase involved in cell wall biosynthesis
MRILIVTDAWYPQINGVVRTLDTVRGELTRAGHVIEVVAPDRFRSIPAPTYPEIPLALFPARKMRRLIDAFAPEAIHIATEGPLGWAARRYCLRRGLPFTTSFHTKFPEYIHARWRIPIRWGYAMMRRFHAPSSGVMVATPSLAETLRQYKFSNLKRWTRGVDVSLFRPRPKTHFNGKRPVFLFTGRVAVEKNIEAFLKLDLPGQKVVIGDGPLLQELKLRYPGVVYTGYKRGEDLAEHMASADVFVFPSLTDTFGLVLLESLASGVPVAAFPVTGPIDVAADPKLGCLDWDLATAARAALEKRPEDCRAYAENFSWRACAEIFLGNLQPFGSANPAASRAPVLISE